MTGPEKTLHIQVALRSHKFVQYFRNEKKELRKMLQVDEIVIRKYSVVVGHEIVQQAWAA